MANVDPLNLTPLSSQYGSITAGQVVTPVTPAGGGDAVGLQGAYTLLRFQTTGTASTITFDSVQLSSFGTDVDITIAMAATQIRKVAIKNDSRFVNAATGRLGVSYSSVVGLTMEAEYIA
jgi:hypothetical protein